MSSEPFRIRPAITPENEHFWKGGAVGELQILRCDSCRYWVHPPAPICPHCMGRHLHAEATSGNGTVFTFTINHRDWMPDYVSPYVIAIVELAEQSGLRLTTNIVDCAPEDVSIGDQVEVVFDGIGDEIHRPLFRKTTS